MLAFSGRVCHKKRGRSESRRKELLRQLYRGNQGRFLLGLGGILWRPLPTLLHLLMAAHDSYSGRICYNGTELKGIRTKSLYDLVSLVQQNLFVINASIRDNITMFRRFPREDVERAIARSLLRKAPVLLVDEATAALDAETVWQVSNSILDLENLTRIVVTHSLEECLLKRYDRILTLY